MQSSTPNQEVVSFLVAGIPVQRSGSMYTTRALEFLKKTFRGSSMPSLVLMPRNATAWASVSSSFVRRWASWVTASTSPRLPAAGLAFPFSSHATRRASELRLLGGRTYEEVPDLKLKWIGGRGLPANLLSRTPPYIAHKCSPAYHAPRPHDPGLSTSGIAKLLSAIPIPETIASGP